MRRLLLVVVVLVFQATSRSSSVLVPQQHKPLLWEAVLSDVEGGGRIPVGFWDVNTDVEIEKEQWACNRTWPSLALKKGMI